MLDQSVEFIDKNVAEVAYPCVTVRQDYTKDGSSHAYLTTHDYAKTPVGATVLNGVIEDISAKTQRLSVDKGVSEIGDISIRLTDVDFAVTKSLFDNAEGTDSLKGREQIAYVGFKDLEFESYAKSYTQIVDGGITKDGDSYILSCSDIQREMRTKLFPKIELTITATIPDDPDHPDYNTIKVLSTAGIYGMVNPSASTDAPGVNCFYIERVSGDDREVIRCLVDGMDATTIIVDPSGGRGALSTTVLEHIVDPNSSASTKFRQYWFMSSSPIELMFMMLTGEQLISQGAAVPPGMSIGISTSKIRRDDYISIGSDLLDTASPADSIVLEFQGDALKEQDGKKFISEQITFPFGLFMPIYSDGSVGLRKLSNVKMDSAYDAVFDNDNVIKSSPIRKNYSAINNAFIVNWDWNQHKKKFNRSFPLVDEFSAARYDSIKEKTLNLYGLNSAKHSVGTLRDVFNRIRDFSSYETYEMSVSVLPEMNFLEEGDFVRYRDDVELDPKTNLPIDRTFLIVRKTENPLTGDLSFNLVGSSAPADIIDIGSGQAVISDVDYEAHGKGDPARDFELLAAGLFTNVNGVLHLEQDFTFNGGTSSNDPSSWLYIDKDLFVDPGVTLTLTKNTQVWHKGVLTNQGTITTAGQGHAGGKGATALVPLPNNRAMGNATAGELGIAGASIYQRGILWKTEEWHWIYSMGAGDFPSYGIGSAWSPLPYLSIKYENGAIHGIPDDLSGTSGAGGGPVASALWYSPDPPQYRGYGGDGGASGGGCAWICRGAYRSGSGLFVTDGADGLKGESVSINGRQFYGGAGGGGNPGAFLFIIDGPAINAPDFSVGFSSKVGATPAQGIVLDYQDDGGKTKVSSGRMPPNVNWYVDNGQIIQIDDVDKTAGFRTFIVPPAQELEIEENGSKTYPPASISVPQSGNSQLKKNADGTVTARAYCSISASPDTLLKGYQWQYKINGGDWITRSSYMPPSTLWIRVDDVIEGDQIIFRCRAINMYRVESSWVTSAQHAVIGKSENPNPPSSLTGVGVVNGIEWSLGGAPDADVISVELHTGPNASFANVDSIKKFSSSGVILEPLSGAQTRYGWVRYQDSSGNWSVFAPLSSSVGASATSLAQDYAGVANAPTQLGDINAAEGTKLTGIEDSATFGSNWDTNLQNRPSESQLLNQILDPSTWIVGPEANPAGFNLHGAASENEIVLSDGPNGALEMLWRCISDGGNDADGGWNSDTFPIDITKTYRFSVPFRRDNIDGTTYFGCRPHVTSNLGVGDSINTNPYFFVGDPPELGKWFLAIGFIHPASYSGLTNYGGIYDYETGLKVASCTDFKHATTADAQIHRAYLYYASTSGVEQFFGRPRVDVLNGAEPAIESILQGPPLNNKLGSIEYGAENTTLALARAVSILTGGLNLGGTDAAIKIGGATDFGVGNGIFAGMSGGFAKFSVGDRSLERDFAVDTETGESWVGRDIEFRGADAINNKSINYHQWIDDYSSLSPQISGGISAGVNARGLWIAVNSSPGEAIFSRIPVASRQQIDWQKNRLLKTSLVIVNLTGSFNTEVPEIDFVLGDIYGQYSWSQKAVIVSITATREIFIRVINGDTNAIYSESTGAYLPYTSITLNIDIDIDAAGANVVLDIEGSQLTHTIARSAAGSSFPAGVAEGIWELKVSANPSGNREIYMSELWFHQDPK